MNVVEGYKAVMSELNQSHAASVLIDDFNYFLFKATDDYIEELTKVYPLTQEIMSKLSPIVEEERVNDFQKTTDTHSEKSVGTLTPIDNSNKIYRKMISVIVESEREGKSSLFKGAARLDEEAYSDYMDDAFDKPSVKKPYFKSRIDLSNGIWALDIYNGGANVLSADVVYFREPTRVLVSSEYLDMSETDARIPKFEFSNTVMKSIIKKIAAYMLENQSSHRTQTLIGVNQEPSLLIG